MVLYCAWIRITYYYSRNVPWYPHKESLAQIFPSREEKLLKILVFEFLIFALCLGILIFSQTAEYESYASQMIAFYIFYASIHLILLMLQNTLSIVESQN